LAFEWSRDCEVFPILFDPPLPNPLPRRGEGLNRMLVLIVIIGGFEICLAVGRKFFEKTVKR